MISVLLHFIQVFIRGIRAESNAKHITDDQPTFGLESPREVNMMELEIPLVMETDGNVEKAEAYTKELDSVSKLLITLSAIKWFVYALLDKS
jgi:hypothetical protein